MGIRLKNLPAPMTGGFPIEKNGSVQGPQRDKSTGPEVSIGEYEKSIPGSVQRVGLNCKG